MRFVLGILCLLAPGLAADGTCADLGFTEGLVCSSCEKMHEAVGDEKLRDECLGCEAELSFRAQRAS